MLNFNTIDTDSLCCHIKLFVAVIGNLNRIAIVDRKFKMRKSANHIKLIPVICASADFYKLICVAVDIEDNTAVDLVHQFIFARRNILTFVDCKQGITCSYLAVH